MRRDVFQKGAVAVVTGAASGIGFATCRELARRGMRVCMADIHGQKLEHAQSVVAELSASPEDVIAQLTDVTRLEQIEALRSHVYQRWGVVNLLMNNAADFAIAFPLERAHWRRVMETNFFGVLFGIQTFVPHMIAGEAPGLILNVGSKLGITNPPLNPAYNASKAAIKNLTESLEYELRQNPGRKLSAALLIPGWTTTGDHEPQPGAWMPDQVVSFMMNPLLRGDFYIVCPDNDVTPAMDRARFSWAIGDIVENRPALSRWHPNYEGVYQDPTD